MGVIRLKEVAAKAGVSISTASSALRGSIVVKPDTRARVEEAARKLGYQKNSAASVLSSLQNRNSQKSVFVVWLTAGGEDLPPIHLPAEATREAEKLGVRFELLNIRRPDELKPLVRTLVARGCDGIILGRGMSSVFGQIDWSRFAVVSIEEHLFEEGADVVRSSLFRSTLEILRQVKRVGYRRIGICLREHEPQHPDDEARLGAVFAFQTYDLKRGERIPLKRISFGKPESAAEIIPWVKKYQPDVVIGFSREDLWRLREGGFSVPGNLAYVSLHVTSSDYGAVAGYQDNQEVYPKYALRILLDKVRHGIRGLSGHPQQTLVLPPLLEGTSCPLLKTKNRAFGTDS